MRSFSDIIDAFGGVVPFRDALELPDINARKMLERDSIPDGYWFDVVKEASERSIDGVTYELLARLAKAKRHRTAKFKADQVA